MRVWLSKKFIGLGFDLAPEGKIKDCLSIGLTVAAELMVQPEGDFTISIEPNEEEETYH